MAIDTPGGSLGLKIKSRAQQITLKPNIIKVKKLLDNVSLFTLKNSLIIHEENTKKNHKRVVSVYVIQIHVIYINFNFDFLGLDNVYF